jgi:hypothetical protein
LFSISFLLSLFFYRLCDGSQSQREHTHTHVYIHKQPQSKRDRSETPRALFRASLPLTPSYILLPFSLLLFLTLSNKKVLIMFRGAVAIGTATVLFTAPMVATMTACKRAEEEKQQSHAQASAGAHNSH